MCLAYMIKATFGEKENRVKFKLTSQVCINLVIDSHNQLFGKVNAISFVMGSPNK